jgi:hypothetical protein
MFLRDLALSVIPYHYSQRSLYSYTMKMEVEYSFETSVMFYQITWHYNRENIMLHSIRSRNPKISKRIFYPRRV